MKEDLNKGHTMKQGEWNGIMGTLMMEIGRRTEWKEVEYLNIMKGLY
jgi:hypothetical protein